MSHIEKRRNLWYATLKVPAALHGKLGRTKFLQSLGTPDKRLAQRLAPPVVAGWQASIREAAGEPDAVVTEAMKWRQAIAAERLAGDSRRVDLIESLLVDKAHAVEQREGEEAAARFADVALGRSTPSDAHFTAWAASITHLAEKTQDQMKKDVRALVDHFATLEEITASAVRRFIASLVSKGAAPSSIKRMVSFWRSYWRHLVEAEAVPHGTEPFKDALPRAVPKAPADARSQFSGEDVVKLWDAARDEGDPTLADLIKLAAYTGARIEELCSLEVAHLGPKALRIVDAKTAAGIREVPIHSALVPLIARLTKHAKDKYLLADLTFNKYGDRSNAIGKRFGRLKTRCGFDSRFVFHSLRKTLITRLEDAGVSENVAADIVGHEKPRITYGLYSGGNSLATKAAALEKVTYPGMT